VLLLGQCLVAARDRGRHIDRSLAAGPIVCDKDQGLAGVLQHQRHLYIVGCVRRYVGRDANRHNKPDVGQRVAQAITGDQVGLSERAVLTCIRIQVVQTV